jgi:hypothetical protein
MFPAGHKGGGRPLGVKNKLSRAFVEALAKDFEEFGERAIRQARVTKPEKYLQIIANLVPREFFFQHGTVTELSDTELDKMIELLRQRVVEEQQRITAESPLMLTVEKVPDAVER